MKQIDFDHGTVTGNILGAALPMLVAQILSLLYNIVDRIYIARIPSVGTTALGAVGLCFPIIVIITAFSNLFGSGGAPLFSINRGKGNIKKAEAIMNTSFSMLCICGVALMVIGMLFASSIVMLFGASECAGICNFRNVIGYNWSRCQSDSGPIVYIWIEFRHKRSGDRNNHLPDFIGSICILFLEKESGIESAGAVKRRMESM